MTFSRFKPMYVALEYCNRIRALLAEFGIAPAMTIGTPLMR
jgi:hypothetical protein